jgi:regulation of enolase protein 1 (concanavalin A-like superfamily)
LGFQRSRRATCGVVGRPGRRCMRSGALLAKNIPLFVVWCRGLSDDCVSKELKSDSVYLRIAKSDRTYVLYFSVDGDEWQIVRTFSLDTEIPVRVGFEAQSPAGSGAVAQFSAISYEPHRIGNIHK